MFRLIAICLILVALTGCNKPRTDGLPEAIKEEIIVPYGYKFIDAWAYGNSLNPKEKYVCQRVEDSKVFECTSTEIERELKIPMGFSYAGASGWGTVTPGVNFYCRQNSTNRIFKCDI